MHWTARLGFCHLLDIPGPPPVISCVSCMESPEVFLLRFFAARNALFRRQQEEVEGLQQEFCEGSLIYDVRLTGYEEERILDVVREGVQAVITTNGNTKGINGRLRYALREVDNAWLVSDLKFECPICHGSGKFRCSGSSCDVRGGSQAPPSDFCKACSGLGWISTKGEVDRLLEE